VPAAGDDDAIGYPVFAGRQEPVPPEPVRHRSRGMMRAIYESERHGTDSWMDRGLARSGHGPAGDWLQAPSYTYDTRVSWREIDPSEYADPGTFVVTGTVEGTSLQARATVIVKEEST
jgi:hypothetical protein